MAQALLAEAGIESRICAGLADLERSIDDQTRFVVLAEEALRTADLRRLSVAIKAQPLWSDLPFIVLTQHGGGAERDPAAMRLSEILGNVSFLERPFHPTTFISLARSAARARRRQFEARARMAELRESGERLQAALEAGRRLNDTLEERVVERTAELNNAHVAMLTEIGQRERAEDLLRQSQKMEMIGQLTGGVAHDFNNLLMAVLGNLELLAKHLPRDPRAARLIDAASQGAQRGAALTQRLLAFARRQDLQIRPTDLVALMKGMTDLLEHSLGPQIELRTDLPLTLPPALIDANQVELALLNLAVNARDAMPEGGTLSIKAEAVKTAACADLREGAYVRLSIADAGLGMDSETLSKATEPFFSTKEVGKGTGLGLSMVHGLAVQLEGALRLTSTEGVGTVAELWLPVTESAVRDADDLGREPPRDPSAPPMKILLVDDDELIAASTADMLEDLGHEVSKVNSGESALRLLGGGQSFDLMITDYLMPRMTGAQLARKARRIRPQMPILLATGYADLAAGAEMHLPRLFKPYQQAQLAEEINRVGRSPSG
ncbi:MAG TPA: response regulator [Caulobacteraceae bacterium]|nr:response regulator [Caulobacteraceae bacterium]